ncbi:MAG: ABC transporter ATP-binding protein/permease [Clostridia bacterium]|nr:ABC transporter ATP-binding protein/permease [Clostridia bacterium]
MTENSNKVCIDSPPEYILSYLEDKNISRVFAAALSDMDADGRYGEVWAIATDKQLHILTGKSELGVWQEEMFASYAYDEVKRFYIDTFISSGILVGVFDELDFELCAFSNGNARKFGHFANLLNKLKNKELFSLEDEEFKDEDLFCPVCGSPYPNRGHKICPKCMKRGALFKRVMSYGVRYKFEIMAVFLGILATAGLGLLRPQLNSRVLFDHVLNPNSQRYGQLVPFILSILALETTSFALNVLNGRIGASISAKIVYDIKLELFSAMQKLSLSFYNSKHTGNLMTRVNNDAQDIQYFISDGMPHFIMNLIMLSGILAIMLSFYPLLAVVVFMPIPLIIYVIKTVVPKFRKYKWNTWAKNSRINSIINDALTGMRVVKAFGREKSEINRFEKANYDLYRANVKEGRTAAKTFPMLSYIMTLGGLFVWGVGGFKAASGSMTLGVLLSFVGYVSMVYGPLDFMVRTFDWYTNCMNSAQRIFEIIDQKPEVKEAENPVPMPNIKGKISIRNVTFEYEPNKPVLHNINLEIAEGEMIGLVGHSGAGKSTITNLITRLYDVNEGDILIDDVNIKNIAFSDLRGQIGMVLQDTFLFSGTIAENIAYARPDATRDEIISAARLANAHDFIMRMPDGYETMIGIRKNNLSGGEKQRISIARAILSNPKILILDEATASVDTETERLIQEALERLVKGRTTIAIAHRLSTLRNADRLVVVERGTIAEVGTHEELESIKGIYYGMLKMQKEALRVRE